MTYRPTGRHRSAPAAEAARWIGWLAAIAAGVCLVLASTAVTRGRAVHASAAATVLDLRRANALFTDVDLTSAQQILDQLNELATSLEQLPGSTSNLVDLLTATTAEVHGISAAGAADAQIATALQATAAVLARQLMALRDSAMGGAGGAADIVALLSQSVQLVATLNGELAAIEQKLQILP